jgi:gamma-D-glutamyl-L-lysine dipeptidyl-peptidase
MKSLITFIAVAAAICPIIVPAAGSDVPKAAVVIVSVENMHSAPDPATDVVSQAILGTNVRIHEARKDEKGEDWFRVETPDTYPGWVSGTALRLLGDTEPPYASEGPIFEVTSLFANVYATADVTERKPLIIATIGARLAAGAARGDRWIEITLPCGMKGWIQRGDGEIADAGRARRRISPKETAAMAERFLGLPYLWGGVSPYGLDCSGYVQLLYHLSGIEILRDAGIQMNASGLLEIRPGREKTRDLVFFGKSKDAITHVGMMIGRGKFIHATTYGKPIVQISRLKDPHWRDLYQAARRANK